ncbi:MAG TPA: hypothetical protein VEL11_09285, partial [Candidatus Bathyarchaeia archaeon]|nr:hypothetical protein [Candidatus Bathyarchaeia archaeon]
MGKNTGILLGVISMLAVLFSGITVTVMPSSADAHRGHSSYLGSWGQQCCILHIPDQLFTPPNQGTIQDLQNVIP